MKSSVTAFAALAALALPASLSTMAHAQEELTADARPERLPAEVFIPAPPEAPQERRGDGDRARGGGQDRGDQTRDRGDRGRGDGGGRDQGDQSRDRGGRGGNDGGGWSPPQPPVILAPPPPEPSIQQDNRGRGGRDRDEWGQGGEGQGGWNGGGQWNGGDQNRGDRDRGDRDRNGQDRDRGNGGRWNSGGNNGQDWNRDRDRDRNGGWNGGWNGNNGQDWNRDRHGGGRNWNNDRNGRRDYGGFSNRWNQYDWRRNWNRGRSRDWWRNDRSFRDFNGVRFGFYFAPNYGYYSVPRSYYGQRYYVGSYLPSIFWRYQLNDYRTYGLGYPPPGTRWVLVDTTIYLIDSYDGYIIDAIYDAWRW
ncbi:RcnB family protein [Brevundimonas sp. AJA228-03]|uniref:RcnB family protein n=1 Tax=Brevundimonas sp. AJA228-03 TaxID=2752515 RepID=UPI001FD81875|nr:RcnB family protein [Brevundimonas sp. AJA228-03]